MKNCRWLPILLLPILLMACVSEPTLTEEGIPQTALDYPEWVRMVEVPFAVQDFALPASTGSTMHLSELRGRWVMLFFGYTHCPDFCPLTLFDFVKVKEMLGADAEDVAFVYISVDGLRDTPDIMRRYLAYFDETFIGLTGDDATLKRIHTDYNLYYRKSVQPGSDTYTVDHSTRTYLIDPKGRMRLSFAYATEPEVMAGVLQDYLAGEADDVAFPGG